MSPAPVIVTPTAQPLLVQLIPLVRGISPEVGLGFFFVLTLIVALAIVLAWRRADGWN